MLKPSLQLKLGQSLTMTPQLQQAIRLLQLPILDLNAQIQEALEENIMLEMEDLPDVPRTEAESTAEVETIKADEQWQTSVTERMQDSGWNGEGRPITEFADESGESLHEHLYWQLEIENFTVREALIGEALVDSINDDGYLKADIDEILESLDEQPPVTAREVEHTLAMVQQLDPVGVGARTLSECIMRQIEQLDDDTPGYQLALDIAADHLDLVASRGLRRAAPGFAYIRRKSTRSNRAGTGLQPETGSVRQPRSRSVCNSRCLRTQGRQPLASRDQPDRRAAPVRKPAIRKAAAWQW